MSGGLSVLNCDWIFSIDKDDNIVDLNTEDVIASILSDFENYLCELGVSNDDLVVLHWLRTDPNWVWLWIDELNKLFDRIKSICKNIISDEKASSHHDAAECYLSYVNHNQNKIFIFNKLCKDIDSLNSSNNNFTWLVFNQSINKNWDDLWEETLFSRYLAGKFLETGDIFHISILLAKLKPGWIWLSNDKFLKLLEKIESFCKNIISNEKNEVYHKEANCCLEKLYSICEECKNSNS